MTRLPRRGAIAVVVVIAAVFLIPMAACLTRRATGEGPWRIEQSRAPRVTIHAGEVRVANARRFTWRAGQDFDAAWSDVTYDLAKLDRLAFYYVPLNPSSSLAHVFIAFGFGPDDWMAVSVEARRRPNEPYTLTRAMLRRYELIYVIGDERDLVGKRAWGERVPVYCWPVKISREPLLRFFLATMNRAEDVATHPELYGVLANTCATNVALNAQRAGSEVPINLDILLSGRLDRLAYSRDVFATDLPFEDAKRSARIDERLRALGDPWPSDFAAVAHRPLSR